MMAHRLLSQVVYTDVALDPYNSLGALVGVVWVGWLDGSLAVGWLGELVCLMRCRNIIQTGKLAWNTQ